MTRLIRRTFLSLVFVAAVAPRGSAEAALKRFSTAEYVILPGLLLGNIGLLLQDPPTQAHWRGGFLFDDGVRNGLRLSSIEGRKTIATVGDVLVAGLLISPILFDAFIHTGLSKKDMDRAAQMSLIATQAILVTAFLRSVSSILVGRERPFQRECAGDPAYDAGCGTPASRTSFFSGHAAFAFTGAGLMCAAREVFELPGGKATCYVALGLATVVSLTRVMADKHYLSDTIVGALVGLFSGYWLPKMLHYDSSGGPGSVTMAPMPIAANGIGLSLGFNL